MADPVTITTGVGWGIKVAGWIVSPIISRLLNRGFSYLGFHSSNKLRVLERKVLQLKLMLEAIELGPHCDRLEPWMKEFRSAFYEAEDIIDAIDYQHLKNRVLSQAGDESAGVNFRCFKQQVVRMSDFKVSIFSRMKLKSSLDRIENLIDEGHKLLQILNLAASSVSVNYTPNSIARSETKTTSAAPVVFGRDNDLTMIRTMLRDTAAAAEPSSSRTRCFSVIGIYGIPGSGKTTLAQYVCEKEKDDGFFDLFMWIHVSQNFSVGSVFTEMLEIASGGKRDQLSNLDMLQKELEEKLRGKRFLLVLDDVWYDKHVSEQQLDLLFSPLKVGKGGSSVLVTSRTANAAKAFGAQRLVLIPDLDEEQYFSMFMHYAIDGAAISDQALLGHYDLIGRKIAEKLGRSPLAARTVAGQLNRRLDVDFWRSSLNRDLLSGTMGALWWSFQQLDDPVRQCFVYCSMFPRRYSLERDVLVRMWVAQGFVQTTNAVEDMEDISNDYFHVLESCSFIQRKLKTTDGTDLFTIHDLLHDLARRVAGDDCFTVEKDMVVQIPQDARHLFIDSRELRVYAAKILKLRMLRTLVSSHSLGGNMTIQDFMHLLQTLKKLRVVNVPVKRLQKIPACIGELKHLRYLGIFGNISFYLTLPSEFTKLYHLQLFFLPLVISPSCSSSNKMTNLINLRHILFCEMVFPNVGRMTQLQTLRTFTVRRTRGYEIQQLEHLDNLRDDLWIEGLENVSSKEEARQAKLANKVHLSRLMLRWGDGWMLKNQDGRKSKNPSGTSLAERSTCKQNPDLQREILEALCPPFQITSLDIVRYRGSTYPSWLTGELSTLKNLQDLSFYECSGCHVPPRIGVANLHTLGITSCSWNSLPENIECLTSLQSLHIEDCRNIRSIPRLPRSLRRLSLVSHKVSNAPPGISDCTWKSLQENMECLTSLEKLSISECKNILSLSRFPSLKKLELNGCYGSDAPSMVSEFFVCLRKLEIVNCDWKSLPENMESLTSLEKLTICSCKSMLSLPTLPKSLKKFVLRWSNRDLTMSCQEEGHDNWQKIKHGVEDAWSQSVIGNDYFHVLESSSFLQLKLKGAGGTDLFTIHDLLHDLARRVAGGDCFTVEKGMVIQIPKYARHVFIDSRELRVYTEKILKLRKLRTLVTSYSFGSNMTIQDSMRLLQTLKKLRVVDVPVKGLENIPICIYFFATSQGVLKHLRYLGIYGTPSSDLFLPSEFTKLYHLQLFSLPLHVRPRCSSSNKMTNLANLRHILFSYMSFPYVGRMTQLRTLRTFTVRRTRGYEIEQMEHLDNLRDNLWIEGLENVNSMEEARQAKLANKVHLSCLILRWEDGGTSLAERWTCKQNPDLQREILEVLCPPFHITSLHINGYSGSAYPSWLMGAQSTLENLQYLSFYGCNECDVPPRISLANLHTLGITSCDWNSLPENIECLTSLQSLPIEDCRNIQSIPRLPPSLKRLFLASPKGSNAPPGILDWTWKSLPENMECIMSLEELTVSECENILSLSTFSSLKKLELNGWYGSDAPTMVSELFVCLRELKIVDCNWKSLPENMESLTSLEKLTIICCKSMLSLPILPQSLKKFSLTWSSWDLAVSCQEEGHENCQKIKHVSEKYFSND
ncbi:hypothetical protein ACP4OV_002387 [Aristida adscensionis]